MKWTDPVTGKEYSYDWGFANISTNIKKGEGPTYEPCKK